MALRTTNEKEKTDLSLAVSFGFEASPPLSAAGVAVEEKRPSCSFALDVASLAEVWGLLCARMPDMHPMSVTSGEWEKAWAV
eukprot:2673179-Rhodomonas_salina.3